MKNIILIIGLLSIINCKAQFPIISTVDFSNNDDVELINGCYLKDVENKFAPFIGTWKWINGNTSLEIQFSKIEMVYDGQIYEDIFIGKYKYVENGIEKHNSLNINITNENVNDYYFYLINGNGYAADNYQQFRINDLNKNLHCYLEVELTSSTQATWKIWRQDGGKQPNGFTFPTEVTLTKQ